MVPSRSSRLFEIVALAAFLAAILLAIAERYVASVVSLLCGIAVLSYLAEMGRHGET